MRVFDDHLIFASTDLAEFLDCEHLTTLRRRVLAGDLERPYFDDPTREVLALRGREHEQRYLESLRAGDGELVEIEVADPNDRAAWERAAYQTTEALRRGVAVVYQGVFFQGDWAGQADFLVRVDRPCDFGQWSYEIVDAKLARHPRARAIVQLCAYSEMLGRVQGKLPERMHLVLGGQAGIAEPYRVANYLAYVQALRVQFLERFIAAEGTYPEPVEHCEVCDFRPVCDQRWRDDDHLCLVAGVTRHQRERLVERGVETLFALGTLAIPPEPPIAGIGKPALARIREQARLQLDGRSQERMLHELVTPVVPRCGLASLPPPSPGDLFLDLEGDPFTLEGGLEYLFGIVEEPLDPAAGDGAYRALWAFDAATEKHCFEELIAFVMERWARYPGMHVYHYAPYEPTALKRLMGRYGTCEEEVDRLLRGCVLVDLYRAVRQGVRASVESYSIKKLEPLYGFARAVDVQVAARSRRQLETHIGLGGLGTEANPEVIAAIERYNRDDCLSACRLRSWLEVQREELERQTAAPVPRPEPEDAEPSEAVREETQQARALFDRLTDGLPPNRLERTEEENGRWVLAQLLEWHRRESKSIWWEYYHLIALTDEEILEDGKALGGLEYLGEVGIVKRSKLHRYRFPRQEHAIRKDRELRDPQTEGNPGSVHAIDNEACTIDLKRGIRSEVQHPTAVIPYELVGQNQLKKSLLRIGAWVADHGIEADGEHQAVRDLLVRRPPRAGQPAGTPLLIDGEDEVTTARRLVKALDRSVLPIQGPPGSGKTFTGAEMIVELVRAGRKAGVTSNSHRVICELLEKTISTARNAGVPIRVLQKVSDPDDGCKAPEVEVTEHNEEVAQALRESRVDVAAGTAWLWSREDMAGAVDVLFVDEAGQVSLANAVALGQGASSLVLLGDPQQLDQPQQGVHPPGAEVSALEHLLGGQVTIPPDRGLFLEHTRRMHPDVCDFVSSAFYENRLRSLPGLERQMVRGPAPLSGTGLRFLSVDHRGNQSESLEEVEAVTRLYDRLVSGSATWVDREGAERPIGPDEVLIVAPYNAQVSALRAQLGQSARVGTVDKFQGQEAPVVIYSMATSSSDDAPRGMEFLYSSNRFNVAISRARCLAVLVASPALLRPRCRTPRQMALANAFCRYLELATAIDPLALESDHNGRRSN